MQLQQPRLQPLGLTRTWACTLAKICSRGLQTQCSSRIEDSWRVDSALPICHSIKWLEQSDLKLSTALTCQPTLSTNNTITWPKAVALTPHLFVLRTCLSPWLRATIVGLVWEARGQKAQLWIARELTHLRMACSKQLKCHLMFLMLTDLPIDSRTRSSVTGGKTTEWRLPRSVKWEDGSLQLRKLCEEL